MKQNNILFVAEKYPLAFRHMDTHLIEQYFTKNATKTGFIYDYENEKWLDLSTVGLPEIKEWATTFNKEGIMPDSDVKLEILDAQNRTAVVKLEMEWLHQKKGVDYILLVKEEEEWKIQTIIYQSI